MKSANFSVSLNLSSRMCCPGTFMTSIAIGLFISVRGDGLSVKKEFILKTEKLHASTFCSAVASIPN